MNKLKPKLPRQFNMVLHDEDARLLEELQQKLNVPNKSHVVRQALKKLAEAEGIR